MRRLLILVGLSLLISIGGYSQSSKRTSAYMYMQNGQLDKAKESIDEAVQHEKTMTDPKTWLYRGMIYYEIARSPLDIYKNLDNRLKTLRAQRLRQIIEAGEGGLNRDELMDDDAYRGLMMAADGYGRGSIDGSINGEMMTISTDDSPVKKSVLSSDNKEEVLHQLISTFKRIWERITR